MRVTFLLAGILCVANLPPQQSTQPLLHGDIYGTVVDQYGQPASGVIVVALPDGPLGAMLPATKTDPAGKYRFATLPWWDTYTVVPTDEWYSLSSSGPGIPEGPDRVTISPEHPVAEFNFRLPPKAGKLQIHLTNRRTGAVLRFMTFDVHRQEPPNQLVIRGGGESDKPLLLPPDRDMTIHIGSQGFLEWSESVGSGKLVRIESGSVQQWDIQLEPNGLAKAPQD